MRRLILIAATAAALYLPTAYACAVEINFGAVLNDADGKPMKDGDQRVMTLGRATMFALMSQYPDDVAQSAEDKLRRGHLALRAYEATKPLDLSVEDLAIIKKYIGKLYSPLVVVRALPLLDGGKATMPLK